MEKKFSFISQGMIITWLKLTGFENYVPLCVLFFFNYGNYVLRAK